MFVHKNLSFLQSFNTNRTRSPFTIHYPTKALRLNWKWKKCELIKWEHILPLLHIYPEYTLYAEYTIYLLYIKIYQKILVKNFEIEWDQNLFLRMSQALLQSNKHELNGAIDNKIMASFVPDLYVHKWNHLHLEFGNSYIYSLLRRISRIPPTNVFTNP